MLLQRYLREYEKQGDATAETHLGLCFALDGSPENLRTAVDLFQRAAEKGHASAQCNLGACYLYGHGVSRDLTASRYWFTRAVEKNHEPARDCLREAELAEKAKFRQRFSFGKRGRIRALPAHIAFSDATRFSSVEAEREIADANKRSKNTEKGWQGADGPQRREQTAHQFRSRKWRVKMWTRRPPIADNPTGLRLCIAVQTDPVCKGEKNLRFRPCAIAEIKKFAEIIKARVVDCVDLMRLALICFAVPSRL